MKLIISFNKIKKSFWLIIPVFLILVSSLSYCQPQFGRKKMPMMDDFESVVKDVEAAMKKMDPEKVAKMDRIFKDAMSGKQPSPSEMAELDQIGKELNDKIQEIKTERGGEEPRPPSIEFPQEPTPPLVDQGEIPETTPSVIEKPRPVPPPVKKPLLKKEFEKVERTLNSLMKNLTSLRQKIASVRDVRKQLSHWQMALDVIITSLATLEGKPKHYKNDLLLKENAPLLNELNKFNYILSKQEPLVPSVDSFGCEQDYYLILGIQSDATSEEIEAAYQKLIEENSEEALEKQITETKLLTSKEDIRDAVKRRLENFNLRKPEIDDSYEILKDPESRNLYDAQRESLSCPSPASKNAVSVVNQLFGQEANLLINQLDNLFKKFKLLELKETEEMKKQDQDRQKKLEEYRRQKTYIYPITVSEYHPYYGGGGGGGWKPSYDGGGYRPGYEPGWGPRPPSRPGREEPDLNKPGKTGSPGGRPGTSTGTGEKTGDGTGGTTTPTTPATHPAVTPTKTETPIEILAKNLDEFNQQFANQVINPLSTLQIDQNFSEILSNNMNKFIQDTAEPIKKISKIGNDIYKDLNKQDKQKNLAIQQSSLKESLKTMKPKREGFVNNINTLTQIKIPAIDPNTGQPVVDHETKTTPLVKTETIKSLIEAKQVVEKINRIINPPEEQEKLQTQTSQSNTQQAQQKQQPTPQQNHQTKST